MKTVVELFLGKYGSLLDVLQKVQRLEIYYRESMALSKSKNIFQIILDLWSMLMSVWIGKYLKETSHGLLVANSCNLKGEIGRIKLK